METDLFQALLDEKNPRGHPLLAAVLYAYCPAAARWWLAGADPVQPAKTKNSKVNPGVPFDPTWQALADLAAGETLKEALSRHGFATLQEAAQEYVAQVDAWRARHPTVVAPEFLPTFTGGRLALGQRFGLQEEFKKFGGRWENFFIYIRSWGFVIPDWERGMRFAAAPALTPVRLAMTLPGVRRPAFWPAWSWVSTVGESRRQVIGLLADGRGQDTLRRALLQRAGPVGEQPWPTPPEVWILDPARSRAEPADLRLPDAALPEVVARLVKLAEVGPHVPLRALQGSSQCADCGFRNQCFLPEGELSPLALAFE